MPENRCNGAARSRRNRRFSPKAPAANQDLGPAGAGADATITSLQYFLRLGHRHAPRGRFARCVARHLKNPDIGASGDGKGNQGLVAAGIFGRDVVEAIAGKVQAVLWNHTESQHVTQEQGLQQFRLSKGRPCYVNQQWQDRSETKSSQRPSRLRSH